MGRPFFENPKEIRLTVRLDKKHSEILERYAKHNKVTRNEAVRRGIERLNEDE
ncbi:CopG family transcriptional regulator [Paenibacillus lentus]|uniref:CopG family transcriptional regulator n=1 Tax=Paenibacillus lentus TaxID=1338368 RepID=A0A3S8RPY5_9BACL|nr:CopG family transcriptional regulator [Paenibacillus lentus]